MNRNLYRIVFNKARGLMMVVAERVAAQRKGDRAASNTGPVNSDVSGRDGPTLKLKTLRVFVGLTLAVALPAGADIVADRSAPPNQQPTVLQAGNGVPLVNIQTPSAAGVSRNTYSQFDVSQQGAILNNSRTNVRTQLAGYVQGNPWLATGSARILVNEVNSNNPSLLHGYLEVAGIRAQVVVANPSGISCDGCGFINANRTTLTTGTPIFSGGDLEGYRVQRGIVTVAGAGMDASQTDYTDIIARAVQVNAGIWANALKVSTGVNEVSADHSRITPSGSGEDDTPALALDVAALGGMYGGKITLIGTEAGVGVRNAGAIGATAGQVSLDANGMVTNSGTINTTSADSDVVLRSKGFANSGSIGSQHNIAIRNDGDASNSGLVISQRELLLDNSGQLTNHQGVFSAQRLDLSAAGLVNDAQGVIQQTGIQALQFTAQGITNHNGGLIGLVPVSTGSGSGGTAGGGTGGSTAGGGTTLPSTAAGGSGSVIVVAPVMLADGVINIRGEANNDGAQIVANGNMALTANNGLQNSAMLNLDKLTVSGNTFSNTQGEIKVSHARINTNTLDNSRGNFAIGESLVLSTHDFLNRQGNLQQLGSANLAIHLAGDLDNTDGRIATNSQNLTLSASALTNATGQIQHVGTGTLQLRAGTLAGNGGQMTSNGLLDLTADNVTLDQSSTTAKQIQIDSTTLSNENGQILQTGTDVTQIKASSKLGNTGGVIASNGNTMLLVGDLFNQDGAIRATGNASLTVNASGAVDNHATLPVTDGGIRSGGAATVTAASLDNSQGLISSGDTLSVVTSHDINNSQGLLASSHSLSATASTIDNGRGTVASVNGGLALSASSGAINNTLGKITAAQMLSTTNQGIDNTDGLLVANSASIDTREQILNNTRGVMITAAGLDLQSGALTNNSGLILSGGEMVVNTHGQAFTNSNSGNSKGLLSQGAMTLATGDLKNATGYIGARGAIGAHSAAVINSSGGIITSESGIALNGTRLDNQAGQVKALGDLSVDAGSGSIDNRTGLLRSGQTLSLAAASIYNQNTRGTDQGIEADFVGIASENLDNRSGAVRANQALRLTGNGQVNNAQGLISSSHTLDILDPQAISHPATKTQTITNTEGILIAGAALNIDSKSLSGDGKILSEGDLGVHLTSDYTHTHELIANGNATLQTSGNLTNQAELLAGSDLTLTAANIDNTVSGEISGRNTNLMASNTLTNRGLINGSNTFISSSSLNNLGSGRIYGDHVAIAASSVTNDKEMVSGVRFDAVIAARDRLDIGAITIINREHALLFSLGDINIGSSLDSYYRAVGSGSTLNNNSATIEALRNIGIGAAQINNTNEHIAYEDRVTSITPSVTEVIDANQYRTFTRTIYDPVVTQTDPGKIVAGNDIRLSATIIINSNSQIVAGGDLNVTGTTILNQGEVGQKRLIRDRGDTWTNTPHRECHGGVFGEGQACTDNWWYEPSPYSADVYLAVNASISQAHQVPSRTGAQPPAWNSASVGQVPEGAGSPNAALNGGNASSHVGEVAIEGPATARPTVAVTDSTPVTLPTAARTAPPNTRLPNSSLFQVNPNPSSKYLVETNPDFADFSTWLSSDYMLAQFALDPTITQKRLGDGFYEQRLILEQVTQLTGRRFIDGYAADEAQYQALMNNGVTYALAHQLIPGVALTDAQMAQLTSDIVWLIEKEVGLPDGSRQKVLVPQLYVRVQPGDLVGSGALLAGQSVNFNLSGDLINNATIAGRDIVSLTADNISNLGGRISSNNTAVSARGDFENIDGRIEGGDSLVVNAGRDLEVISTTNTTTSTAGANSTSRTTLNRIAGLFVTNPEGILVASAGNDVRLIAAQVLNTGSNGRTLIDAGRDLTLGTVTVATQDHLIWDSENRQSRSSSQEVGTTVQTAGNLTLNARRDLTARAAEVASAQGAIAALAGGDLTIEAGQATQTLDETHQRKSNEGFLSSTTTRTRDTFYETTAVASSFSGSTVNLTATDNLNLIGSNLYAVGDMFLRAEKDINILAAQETTSSSHYSETIKTANGLGRVTGVAAIAFGGAFGLGGLAAAGSLGLPLLIPSSNQETAQQTTTTLVGSTLSAGTIEMISGQDTTVSASKIVAEKDVAIHAKRNLNILSAEQTQTTASMSKSKTVGFIGSWSQPAIGVAKQKLTEDTATITQVGSQIGSLNGSVNLSAGQRYKQSASDVIAISGDVNISGQQVDIIAADNSYQTTTRYQSSQTSVGVGVSNPILSAAQNAKQMEESSKKTADDRIKALAVATAALSGYNAASSIASGLGVESSNLADRVGGVNLNVTVTHSKSSSETVQTGSIAQGSHITASGDVNITAIGAGKESDITVIGSAIKAGDDANLTADDQINLLAAKNANTLDSKNKSGSASLGVGVSLGSSGAGPSVTASGNAGKGMAKGNDETWTETTIQSGNDTGNTVTLQSGTDTTLKGAIVSGNEVVADVGTSGHGNLSIESLQDISDYKSRQQSVGGSVSVPIGPGVAGGTVSASRSKVNSNYVSVNEQSGIKAGDGGFEINVKGNTDLKGAVIASTDKATQEKRNSLTTGTLTTSDIQNKAEYDAKAFSGSIGAGSSKGGTSGTAKDAGGASSTTRSGVTDASVTIANSDKQQTLTGNDAVATVVTLNRDVKVNQNGETVDSQGNATASTLAPVFDKNKVERELNVAVTVTQEFSQVAPQAMENFAQSKIKALNAKAEQAYESGDKAKGDQLREEAAKWKEGGNYRSASNILIAAIGGGETGATSALSKELLSAAADAMRRAAIKDSERFPGLVDKNGNVLSNTSGKSDGVDGDGTKIAGGRIDLSILCAAGRCTPDSSAKSGYSENATGQVILNGITIQDLKQTPAYAKATSPMGGHQGGEGKFLFWYYKPGSVWDKVAESYAGTHDTFNSFWYYDNLGNNKKSGSPLGDIPNWTDIGLATPFGLSKLLPADVWNAFTDSVFIIK